MLSAIVNKRSALRGAKPSNITVHVRMLDDNAEAQQQALGVLGVNLIYAAYHYFENPKQIIDSLDDGIKANRIAVHIDGKGGGCTPLN